MKKTISMLLVVLMLVSLCTNAFAAEMVSSPELIIEHLNEWDARAQTVEEQAVNGAYCLAEMLGCAAAVRATDEEYAYINSCLEQLYDNDAQTLGNQQSIALGAMQIFNLLELIAEQEDPDIKYQSNRDNLRDYFDEGDKESGIAKQQTVNALYSAALMAGLIMEEISPTEEMIANIETELEAFSEDNNVCETVDDQIVNGAYWLHRMLTGIVTLISPSDDYAETAMEISNESVQAANEQPDLETELVVWLYNCVRLADLFAEELLSEAE